MVAAGRPFFPSIRNAGSGVSDVSPADADVTIVSCNAAGPADAAWVQGKASRVFSYFLSFFALRWLTGAADFEGKETP